MHLKYQIILSVFIWCIANKTNGQSWYFNEVYNPNNTWCGGLSITSIVNGYTGCAISGDEFNYYQISMIGLQSDGNLISCQNLGEAGIDYYPGENGSFKRDGENGYYVFGSIDPPGFLIKGIFIYFNSSGDTLFTKIFEGIHSPLFIGRNCLKTNDNAFILCGNEYIQQTNESDFCIIKTDDSGNEIWRSYQGTDIWDDSYSIIQTADNGYAVGGWSYIPGQVTSGDPIIIKTDSCGNFEWSVNLGGSFKDDRAIVCNTSDNSIVVLTGYADSTYTPQFSYARINLVKIDLQGNIIWNKKYGPSKKVNLVSNIILLENGDFMACGYSKYATYLPRAGWLFRFNQDGDSLWYRDYWYYPEGPNYGQNYLYDVSQTADNGFVAVGQAYADGYPNNVQKMWVVKVDSLGCLVAGCDTLVGLDEEHGGLAVWGHVSVVVWPNPCSDVLHISLTSRQSLVDSLQSVGQLAVGQLDRFRIELYDIFGRDVTGKLSPSSNLGEGRGGGENGRMGGGLERGRQGWQINVSSLPPGIYIAVVRDERSLVGTAKFVVAR